MIELQGDALELTFPEVHPEARLHIHFQRTLRIPDDGRDYPLPPGLGRFPLRHVDDFAHGIPSEWVEHGGVMLPMYQAEALWLCFESDEVEGFDSSYPFAIKVAAGKVDAVSGEEWSNQLHRRPRQDYLVSPDQPWLDGYCVEEGIIRQFVAMPLGAGYSAEEQLTGAGVHGGLQIMVFPMKRRVFYERFAKVRHREGFGDLYLMERVCEAGPAMGLAPGGRMRQRIYADPYYLSDWDTGHGLRCYVHITNSMVWRAITGQAPPALPLTAADYSKHGLPWFEHYSELPAVAGSDLLAKLKSVIQLGRSKREQPLPENQSTTPQKVIILGDGTKHRVREWEG